MVLAPVLHVVIAGATTRVVLAVPVVLVRVRAAAAGVVGIARELAQYSRVIAGITWKTARAFRILNLVLMLEEFILVIKLGMAVVGATV